MTPAGESTSTLPVRYLALAMALVVAWLAVLPLRPLFNPDEGRYAEIAREMLAGGDWVIPHLNGLEYLEKPPLQYWATAAALAVFGANEFGARCYTAACALATLSIVWWVALRLWGRDAAWRAAAVLSGMGLFVVLGQLLTLDMSLTFYMTLSLAGFLLAQRPEAAAHGRGGMLLAWIAAALGVLTKGPVAAVIPAAVLIVYSVLSRELSPWRRLHASLGLPVFLVITVPWHWLAARREPQFLSFYFVHEHVARYLTPSADREEAWWFFGAVFALGSLPWVISALRVVFTGWRRHEARGRFDARLFLWVWVVFVVLFFSVSDSKLVPYLLPAFPALAWGIAASPAPALRREVAVTAVVGLLAAAALTAAAGYGPRLLAPTERNQYFIVLAPSLASVAALLTGAGAWVLLRRSTTTGAIVLLGATWCLSSLLLMRAAAAVAPIYSGVVLARALGTLPAAVPVYSIGTYDQTLPFYWRRTMTLVAYRGELDFGLRQAPRAGIPSVEEFIARWRAAPEGVAVMEKSMFEELARRDVPMREVAHDVRRVLVTRQ